MRDEPILAEHRVELAITIRPCRRSDLRALEWGGRYTSHRGVIEHAFEGHRRGENLMLVADARGFPVGQIWIDLARYADEGIAVLWALRVLPGLRSLGIGRLLVACAERAALEQGYTRAEIGVEHDNPGARWLYERLGYMAEFEEESRLEHQHPDGEIVVETFEYTVMRRDLEEDASVLQPTA